MNDKLKTSITAAQNNYNETVIQLNLESKEPFQEVIIKLLPENYRHQNAPFGQSHSHLQNHCEINLQSAIIREMQRILFEYPEEISSFLFEVDITVVTGKKQRLRTSERILVQSPWKNASEADQYPHGETILFEDASNMPKSQTFEVELTGNFQSDNPIELYKTIDNLGITVKSLTKATEVDFVLLGNKNQLSPAVKVPKLNTNETYQLSLGLFQNLHDLLKETYDSYYIEGNDAFNLNIEIHHTDHSGKRLRTTSNLKIPNPWYELLKLERKACTVLVRNVLDQYFPTWEGQIDEDDDWVWFSINDINFQFGLNGASVHLSADLDGVSYNADQKVMRTKMKELNNGLKIKLKERDNLFTFETRINYSKLKAAQLAKTISDLMEISTSNQVQALIGEFKK